MPRCLADSAGTLYFGTPCERTTRSDSICQFFDMASNLRRTATVMMTPRPTTAPFRGQSLIPGGPVASVAAVVADDDDDTRELIACAMQRAGFRVRQVRDGEELVVAVRTGLGSRIVVVSDIGMPRRDGIAATQALRANGPRVPIVLVTAFLDVSTLRRAMSAGADHLLQKPLDLALLVDISLELAHRYWFGRPGL